VAGLIDGSKLRNFMIPEYFEASVTQILRDHEAPTTPAAANDRVTCEFIAATKQELRRP
jgi:hypothetical protein